jgi:hypothetical protein
MLCFGQPDFEDDRARVGGRWAACAWLCAAFHTLIFAALIDAWVKSSA